MADMGRNPEMHKVSASRIHRTSGDAKSVGMPVLPAFINGAGYF
jgi:hypothetical protein